MECSKNGIKKVGESCTLNNNCIYPNCMCDDFEPINKAKKDWETVKNIMEKMGEKTTLENKVWFISGHSYGAKNNK